jgi:hypothetical protein
VLFRSTTSSDAPAGLVRRAGRAEKAPARMAHSAEGAHVYESRQCLADAPAQVLLESSDYTEASPLHCAAALGDAESCVQLLKAGANPRARDAEGLCPLHLAVCVHAACPVRIVSQASHVVTTQANGGHLAACKALTCNWAPVNEADFDEGEGDCGLDTSTNGRTPSQAGRVAALGASLYIARRGTALHVCAAAARLACAQHLLAAGAQVDSPAGAQRSRPLHIASREGHTALARALLDAGAAVDATDEYGETPLMRATELGSLPMVHYCSERALLLARSHTCACCRYHYCCREVPAPLQSPLRA